LAIDWASYHDDSAQEHRGRRANHYLSDSSSEGGSTVIGKVGTLLGAVAVILLLAAGSVGATVALQPPPDRPSIAVPATQTLEVEPTPDTEPPVPVQQLPDPTTTTPPSRTTTPTTPATATNPSPPSGGSAVSFTIADPRR
jgi:hypothetical protein